MYLTLSQIVANLFPPRTQMSSPRQTRWHVIQSSRSTVALISDGHRLWTKSRGAKRALSGEGEQGEVGARSTRSSAEDTQTCRSVKVRRGDTQRALAHVSTCCPVDPEHGDADPARGRLQHRAAAPEPREEPLHGHPAPGPLPALPHHHRWGE